MSAPTQFDQLRDEMVTTQIAARGITNPRVLEAMRTVPRERFVPEEFRAKAFADGALPIDCEQTISQPLIVAMMSDALRLAPVHRVLEIGTGSGYQAAVLSKLAGHVISIERHEELARAAAALLQELECDNVTVLVSDGTLGHADDAPYDRIIVTAATDQVPPALLDQLTDGGRMVIPIGGSQGQTLMLIHKAGGQVTTKPLIGCRFVPLVPGAP